MIEVDRANHQRAIASLDTAKKKLQAGTHIWIAPEGTRSETGALLPFKKGRLRARARHGGTDSSHHDPGHA